LVRIAREVLVIAQRVRVDRGKVSLQQIESAADRWACYQRRHKRADTSYWPRQLFVATASSWFGFLGWLRQPDSKTSPFTVQLEQFVAFMRDERGLSAATIRNRCWHLEKFLDSLPSRKNSLAKVCLPEVDAYLARRGDQGWSRVSVASAAGALRSFFRYAESRHWCRRGICAGIDGPRLFAQERLPRGPDWQVVQRLITDAAEGANPKDIRDHAILMLLAWYGLRSGEVAGLRLDDVDWQHESLCITRPKQRRTQHYPLQYAVGEAILRYLREVRPHCVRRELFLTRRSRNQTGY
jgi:site-specific recombinase XerD